MACTGIEFCKLAIVETKAYATDAVLALEDARRCAARTGEHLNEALSEVAHLHA